MTKPDFLIIPMVVYDHPDLTPTDRIIYAVVYWFEHMRDGVCRAGNPTIANVARVDERTVRVGLERLEAAGFIRRVFKDETKKRRMRIESLVRFGVGNKVPPSRDQESLPGIEKVDQEETPAQFARRFFSGDLSAYEDVIEPLRAKLPGKETLIETELRKFQIYWLEKNKTGKKRKWELQETFEVRRRVATWFMNVRDKQHTRRAGAGSVV